MKWLLTVALASVCLIASMRVTAAEKEEADDAQTIVYFVDRGPLLIKVHLRIDGKSHRQAWKAFTDELFDHLDSGKKGELSKKEAAAAPPAAALSGQGGFFGGTAGDMDADKDGVLTRAELREFYRKSGLPPFQISGTGRPSNVVVFDAVSGRAGGERPGAEALNARLFELLDADRDGKLSREELAALPKALGKFDRDEDEMVTPGELTGRRPTNVTDGGVVLALTQSIAPVQRNFHVLGEGRTDRDMARLLLDFYARRGKKVEAKRLGLRKLDRDEDGWLDAEELSRLREVTPDVELTVRLGTRDKDQPLVEVNKKSKVLKKVESTKEGAVLTLDNMRLEFRGPEKQPQNFVINTSARYKMLFGMADADNNGYLDRQEAEKSPFFRNLFAAMDRDGDGQLFEKEMVAYLDRMAKLRASAAKCCCSLVIKDDGKGLFEHVDADGDGRLSVRELRNAAKVLLALDGDGDGKLAATEVPRNYRGAFEEGSVSGGGGRGEFAVFVRGRMQEEQPPARTKGPLWFRKMDRNRDGDVSRNEWLGTKEKFDEIDADKDGLISPDEAEAYDRKVREKK